MKYTLCMQASCGEIYIRKQWFGGGKEKGIIENLKPRNCKNMLYSEVTHNSREIYKKKST